MTEYTDIAEDMACKGLDSAPYYAGFAHEYIKEIFARRELDVQRTDLASYLSDEVDWFRVVALVRELISCDMTVREAVSHVVMDHFTGFAIDALQKEVAGAILDGIPGRTAQEPWLDLQREHEEEVRLETAKAVREAFKENGGIE